ncbi:MAG: FAD-dependent oxidoreductase [Acidobacteriota bacterium]
MSEHDYDVLVLGGGSAGTSAASAAVAAGARTAMINDGELGGLCILRGCMPTKALLASAHEAVAGVHAEELGLRFSGSFEPDFPAIMARKDAQVARFKKAKVDSIDSADYEVIDGRGRFVEGEAIEVNGKRLTAKSYVIATGSAPNVPPIDGLDEVGYLTSDSVMALTEQPESLLVQGGGAIGLELAQFFARIGTKVVLASRSPLLARLDPSAGEELSAALASEIEIHQPASLSAVEKSGELIAATISGPDGERRFEVEKILIAAGRGASLSDIGLEHVGLTPERGRLKHDARLRTDNPRVFLAGDSTGQKQILHLANQEGRVAGHNAAGGEPQEIDYRLFMSAIFTDPPFAQVGITPKEAEERIASGEVVVGQASFPSTGRAITMGVKHGEWKLLVDRASGEILGSTIVGPRADDLVHVISVMMHGRMTVDDVLVMPWYHPTLSEVMLNLVRDVAKQRGTGAVADQA